MPLICVTLKIQDLIFLVLNPRYFIYYLDFLLFPVELSQLWYKLTSIHQSLLPSSWVHSYTINSSLSYSQVWPFKGVFASEYEQESHGPFSGLVNRRAFMHVFHALSPRQKHRSHTMKTGRHKKEAVAWVSKSQLARKLPAEEHPFRFSVNKKEATSLISN